MEEKAPIDERRILASHRDVFDNSETAASIKKIGKQNGFIGLGRGYETEEAYLEAFVEWYNFHLPKIIEVDRTAQERRIKLRDRVAQAKQESVPLMPLLIKDGIAEEVTAENFELQSILEPIDHRLGNQWTSLVLPHTAKNASKYRTSAVNKSFFPRSHLNINPSDSEYVSDADFLNQAAEGVDLKDDGDLERVELVLSDDSSELTINGVVIPFFMQREIKRPSYLSGDSEDTFRVVYFQGKHDPDRYVAMLIDGTKGIVLSPAYGRILHDGEDGSAAYIESRIVGGWDEHQTLLDETSQKLIGHSPEGDKREIDDVLVTVRGIGKNRWYDIGGGECEVNHSLVDYWQTTAISHGHPHTPSITDRPKMESGEEFEFYTRSYALTTPF